MVTKTAASGAMLRGAEAVEMDRMLASRIDERWQAWQERELGDALGSALDAISDEEWAQAVLAYRGGDPSSASF